MLQYTWIRKYVFLQIIHLFVEMCRQIWAFISSGFFSFQGNNKTLGNVCSRCVLLLKYIINTALSFQTVTCFSIWSRRLTCHNIMGDLFCDYFFIITHIYIVWSICAHWNLSKVIYIRWWKSVGCTTHIAETWASTHSDNNFGIF